MPSAKGLARSAFHWLGYDLIKIPGKDPNCPELPAPSMAIRETARERFSNTFPIAPDCGMSREEIEKRIASYFWHHPFQFGDLRVETTHETGQGEQSRHFQRYMHIFPTVLSLAGGTLAGHTVLDVACNTGFWSIQARRAGAE